MASKYMLAEGTTLHMSKEEVKDTSGNTAASDTTAVTLIPLADTTKTIEYSGQSTDEIDVTTLGSNGFKETALGLTDPGEFSFAGHYYPKDETQKEIVKAAEDKKLRLFKVTFPDGTTFEVAGRVKTDKWSVSGTGDVVIHCVVLVPDQCALLYFKCVFAFHDEILSESGVSRNLGAVHSFK